MKKENLSKAKTLCDELENENDFLESLKDIKQLSRVSILKKDDPIFFETVRKRAIEMCKKKIAHLESTIEKL